MYHVQALQNPSTFRHISSSFGLNEDSILHQSAYFHVTEGLVPDIMHDVLEGCLPYVTKEMLKVFVNEKLISLLDLNDIILSFSYGLTDARNKPAIISNTTLKSKDHCLKQTGIVESVVIQKYMCIFFSISNVVFRKVITTNDWLPYPI